MSEPRKRGQGQGRGKKNREGRKREPEREPDPGEKGRVLRLTQKPRFAGRNLLPCSPARSARLGESGAVRATTEAELTGTEGRECLLASYLSVVVWVRDCALELPVAVRAFPGANTPQRRREKEALPAVPACR